VSKCADRRDAGGRFALGSVYLKFLPDNRFQVEATDAHIMIRVTGPCGSQDGYPVHPGLEAIPNGSDSSLVPYETWDKAFAMAKRTTRKCGVFDDLKQLAVQIGTKVEREVEKEVVSVLKKTKTLEKVKQIEQVIAFGATDLKEFPMEQIDTIQGRWVPTENILNAAKWNENNGSMSAFCPVQLSTLMDTIADVLGEEERRVEMVVKGNGKPVWFTAKNDRGFDIQALIQPLVD
jgi:hypothetical protein